METERQNDDQQQIVSTLVDIDTSTNELTIALPRQLSYKPQTKLLPFILIIVVRILFIKFLLAQSCAKVVTLNAHQSECTTESNGATECVLNDVTRISLVPQGQEACLLIKDQNNELAREICLLIIVRIGSKAPPRTLFK